MNNSTILNSFKQEIKVGDLIAMSVQSGYSIAIRVGIVEELLISKHSALKLRIFREKTDLFYDSNVGKYVYGAPYIKSYSKIVFYPKNSIKITHESLPLPFIYEIDKWAKTKNIVWR